jgi:hypothetical protein
MYSNHAMEKADRENKTHSVENETSKTSLILTLVLFTLTLYLIIQCHVLGPCDEESG